LKGSSVTDGLDVAAEWWRSNNGVDAADRIGKIDTKLAYGGNGNVVAWGSACKDAKNLKVRRLFKSGFSDARADDSPLGIKPPFTKELNRWCSDYLQHFGGNIIEEITREERISQQELIADWHLTTPGLVRILRSFCLNYPVLFLLLNFTSGSPPSAV
jgi:hypothetical protein